MRSWTIGRVLDIPLRINITLVVFLPILAYLISRESYREANVAILELLGPHGFDLSILGAGIMPWIIGFAAAVGLFAGVTLHELGHAWTAMRYDIGITSITLWIFGGVARLEDIPEDWEVEFWIAIAGPLTSLALGLLAFGVYLVIPPFSQAVLFVLGWLALINVVLAFFNLLPAFPMDGGRILRALLARDRPYVEATRIAASIGKGLAVAMAILGILAFAPLLILVSLFVYIAATGESRATVLRDVLRGVSVADVMDRPDAAIARDATVQRALEAMIKRRVTGLPVVESDGAYHGFITLGDIQTVPAERRSTTPVDEVADRGPPTADAFDVLQVFARTRTDRVAVVAHGKLVGLISHRDIVAAIEVFQGLRAGRPDLLPGSGYP